MDKKLRPARNITSRAIFLIFIPKLHTIPPPSCFTRVSTYLPLCHRNKRRVEKCIKIMARAKAAVVIAVARPMQRERYTPR